ncbi:unnamed protein product [Effrenium voratum]|nr:unnamed protein product [Effrenium voratum]
MVSLHVVAWAAQVAAFQPKESAHCLQWQTGVAPQRLRVEGGAWGPALCRQVGANPLATGFLAHDGRCIPIATGEDEEGTGDLPAADKGIELATAHPDCEVWWREVSEDVIPPTPELAMPLWEGGEVFRSGGLQLGLCRSFGSPATAALDGGSPRLGHIALEGPEIGRCRFRADRPKALIGGLFHILQARPMATPCSQDPSEAARLRKKLLWRVEHFLGQEEQELLERVVGGGSFVQLLEGTAALDSCQLQEVLSASRFVLHPLNSLGLHLLRALLARRMYEARLARGYASHPDYKRWLRDGLLIKDLDDPALGGDQGVLELLRMVSGEDFEGIPEKLEWQQRNVTMQEADPQSQIHIDTFAPIVKVWVFHDPPGINMSQGPLLFARGSQRNTEDKLRWMHAYAQLPAAEARAAKAEPSFRLRGCAAAVEAASAFVLAAEGEVELEATAAAEPVLPLKRVRRTLVLADTSALHARGPGVPGTVRESWRLKGDNDGGLKRLNPFRLEAKQEL